MKKGREFLKKSAAVFVAGLMICAYPAYDVQAGAKGAADFSGQHKVSNERDKNKDNEKLQKKGKSKNIEKRLDAIERKLENVQADFDRISSRIDSYFEIESESTQEAGETAVGEVETGDAEKLEETEAFEEIGSIQDEIVEELDAEDDEADMEQPDLGEDVQLEDETGTAQEETDAAVDEADVEPAESVEDTQLEDEAGSVEDQANSASDGAEAGQQEDSGEDAQLEDEAGSVEDGTNAAAEDVDKIESEDASQDEEELSDEEIETDIENEDQQFENEQMGRSFIGKLNAISNRLNALENSMKSIGEITQEQQPRYDSISVSISEMRAEISAELERLENIQSPVIEKLKNALDSKKYHQEERAVTKYKFWTVKFSGEIDANSVDASSVFVVDSNDNVIDVEVEVSEDGKAIIVKPVEGYVSGQKYTLAISSIRSTDSEELQNLVSMEFETY